MEHENGKYRVDVLVLGERTWATNRLRFDTVEEAEAYARNLYGRWSLMERATVVEDAKVPEREPYIVGARQEVKL